MSMPDPVSQQTAGASRRGAWFTGAVLAVACAAAYWLVGSAASRDPGTKPGLTVPPARLDLGKVWETERFTWTLPVQNTTAQTADIMGFASSCSCVAIHPGSVVIPPGETAEVKLVLNLAARSGADSEPGGTAVRAEGGTGNPPSWPFEAHIVPHVRGGIPNQEGWSIAGLVQRPFHIQPQVLDFGERLLRDGPFAPQSVVIRSYVPGIKELHAACDGTKAEARVVPVDGAPGTYRLTVTPAPTLPSGPFRLRIRVVGPAPDGTEVPGFVFARGVVLRDVCAEPEKVVFGARPAGQTCQETLLLRSRTGKALTVHRVQAESKGLVVQDEGQAAGGRVFRLTQRVCDTGHCQGKVVFTLSEDGSAVMEEMSVEVAYHGLAATSPSEKAISNPDK